jgi:hypothetical protein
MNEKIRLLAEQARKKPMGDSWCYTTPQEFEQKFAELIVKECVDVLNKRFMGDLNREDMEVRQCIADVNKHFGVE